MDILPHLLLPLAGPEEFPEDDMEKLPPDLQYLDENKQREADPDIRRMLLDSLLQVGWLYQKKSYTGSYRAFSLSCHKKMNLKPFNERSQNNEML